MLHLEGARALAEFGRDYYAGRPAITEHHFEQGSAYYVATRPEPQLLRELLDSILAQRGIAAPLCAPEGVEVTQRWVHDRAFTFLLNHQADAQVIDLPSPLRDLLTRRVHERQIELSGRGVAILAAPATE